MPSWPQWPCSTLSIVAPCFNEQQVLPDFLRRVAKVCTALCRFRYEIVLVDDGSQMPPGIS